MHHFCFSYFLLPVSGFCLEFVKDGLTFAVSPVLWKEENFAVWKERFEGICTTKNQMNVLNGTDAGTNDKKYEIWTYLVQCLDSRCILVLTNNCKGDGPKA